MAAEPSDPSNQERPDFMVTLGLLPPYTADDVRMAYREKAKALHPDRGGSADGFQKLHEAYEQALEYVKFRSSRRHWLAGQVGRYAEQEAVIAEVRRLGGQVEIEQIDWLKRSLGPDFALLTQRLRGIRARGLEDGDAFLSFLAAHGPALEFLVWLDLAHSRISDAGLQQLRAVPELKHLNLGGTPVSRRGLRVLRRLRRLKWLNIGGTRVGWWTRWRLRLWRPRLKIVTEAV